MSETLGPVIVTGGCGFIGSHLVTGILQAEPGCQIHVIDIDISRNQVPNVAYHECDIASSSAVERVFQEARPQTIFHVACPDSMILQPSVFQNVNVNGAHNLLVAARKTGSRAFINTSTSSVIHDNHSDLIDADENLPILQYPAQKRIYTLTKAVAEAEILAANREHGDSSLMTVSIRPASAFGARDTVTMGKIVANARAGKSRIQIGPGHNVFDFVYISNLVDAHILAARALLGAYGKPPPPSELRIDGECFNVTNDEPMRFWDFQRAISASVGIPVRPDEIRVVPFWIAYLSAFISEWVTWIFSGGRKHPIVTREAVSLTTITKTLNCEKAKRRLNYKPKVSMQEGLAIAGKWFVEEAEREADAKKTA
ncbi:C-3 sterol dehydrogenase/C-4 decarboxylase family protein [Nemania sp. NC0429]|nr:C-3 sterol dehydrogenase/C-4 decarboxylase family protein [Nemania sp. NC0429]